jgi:hypothetical protein
MGLHSNKYNLVIKNFYGYENIGQLSQDMYESLWEKWHW